MKMRNLWQSMLSVVLTSLFCLLISCSMIPFEESSQGKTSSDGQGVTSSAYIIATTSGATAIQGSEKNAAYIDAHREIRKMMDQEDDTVAATVNGQPIYRKDVQMNLLLRQCAYEQNPQEEAPSFAKTLDSFILYEVIQQEGRKQGILDQATREAAVWEYIAQQRSTVYEDGTQDLALILEATGWTEEEYADYLENHSILGRQIDGGLMYRWFEAEHADMTREECTAAWEAYEQGLRENAEIIILPAPADE